MLDKVIGDVDSRQTVSRREFDHVRRGSGKRSSIDSDNQTFGMPRSGTVLGARPQCLEDRRHDVFRVCSSRISISAAVVQIVIQSFVRTS